MMSHGKNVALAWALAACSVGALCAGPVQAQGQAVIYPKQIRVVVPFSVGGSNDLFARALSQRVSTKLGITMIVDNKPGAGGAIGADFVARSEPDGANLLLTSVTFSTNAGVQTKLPYDALKSFVPVAMVARGPMLLTVANNTPWKTPAEYVAAARNPKLKINYGSAGVGSIGQMGSELLNAMSGGQALHVPYKGISNAVTDMIGGNLDMMITTAASVSGPLKAGLIRPIAVTSAQRSKFAPGLPAISEVLPGYSVESWWGVFAPAKTPKALVDALNAEIRAAGETPELRELYARESTEPSPMTSEQFSVFLSEEIAKWRKLAKERNIVAE